MYRLIGETGWDTISLIKKLNQWLNNDENKLEFIDIHPGITNNIIKKKMIEIKNKKFKWKLWVFFDELNTCNSFALLTEIL
jgi:hypothetical protein